MEGNANDVPEQRRCASVHEPCCAFGRRRGGGGSGTGAGAGGSQGRHCQAPRSPYLGDKVRKQQLRRVCVCVSEVPDECQRQAWAPSTSARQRPLRHALFSAVPRLIMPFGLVTSSNGLAAARSMPTALAGCVRTGPLPPRRIVVLVRVLGRWRIRVCVCAGLGRTASCAG